ncbi:hypothetical protein V7S43_017084 [Phytophthora oleae]|uniref:Uncharacterized protein n=1 Tax=Phytophthora oleae TaxID=2107226 RepID=A0ABD3EUN0_9STRA
MNKWLDLRVEWTGVANQQYSKVEERADVLGRLSTFCQAAKECGASTFTTGYQRWRAPSYWSSSTAFKRCFYGHLFVPSPLRTRMSNGRAHRQLIRHQNREEI